MKAGKRALYAAALLDRVEDLRKWAEDGLTHEVFRELDRVDGENTFIQRVDELRREVFRIVEADNLIEALGLNADASDGERKSALKAALLRIHPDKLELRHPHLKGVAKLASWMRQSA